jgi:transposase
LPQALLPLIPEGSTRISERVSVVRENGEWSYFVGIAPFFTHGEDDLASFRMFTSQLVCQGACSQMDIVRAFGVSAKGVKRYVKKYRQEGIPAFYRSRKTRGATVITNEMIGQAQTRLSVGMSRREVAEQLGIKYDTLRKAINQGRLRELAPPPQARTDGQPDAAPESIPPPASRGSPTSSPQASDKSQRSVEDVTADMGMACTRPIERVLAAVGLLEGASTEFEDCRDVTFGGVLCALPALTANGLFEHLPKCLPALSGYYTTLQVVTLLATMALCRIKTVEQLQYESPGELGKLLGLDRVPEVRCLRHKLAHLSQNQAPEIWAGVLSQQWFQDDPELAGTLYVDGHVRLYHGNQTELPRRYVSRQRLCLRGTTDYWVNDALGQPFFRVERPIDQGMLEAIQSDIVPQLLRDVPRQPSAEELDANPHRCRFVLIFDREGYSPVFFKQMWQMHRIGCISYHKFPKQNWEAAEFVETVVTLPRGELVSLKLAERGSWIGDKPDGLWVREVRKLNPDGHQTSLISSAYEHAGFEDAAQLFSRWSQENFFRYMMEHYGIDLLSEYQTEEIPGTNRPVVNPRWRELDSRIRSVQGQLSRKRAEFAAHTMHPETDLEAVPKWEKRKRALRETIEPLEQEWEKLKQQRQETPHHLKWEDFPLEDQFKRLAPSRKRLLDTVKMVAYRAETAMTQIVREVLAREHDARSLIRDLLRSEADLVPNLEAPTLTVRVHPMANPRANRAIEHLLAVLNATESTYPGTTLKLVYCLVGTVETASPFLQQDQTIFRPDQEL